MAFSEKYGLLKIPGIPDDEPVFILRAQDMLSLPLINAYVYLADEHGCEDEFFEKLNVTSYGFKKWQNEHSSQVKRPD